MCLLVVLIALPSVGCYEHVVGAKGYGTEGVTIHEPNIPDETSGPTDADRRAKYRRDLRDLNRSAPRAY